MHIYEMDLDTLALIMTHKPAAHYISTTPHADAVASVFGGDSGLFYIPINKIHPAHAANAVTKWRRLLQEWPLSVKGPVFDFVARELRTMIKELAAHAAVD